LVQLTMPGAADVYQGCELSGFALVDPDNRRLVDYARHRALLAAQDAAGAGPAPAADLDAEKLLVTSRALRLRREHPGWFTTGYAAGRAPARSSGGGGRATPRAPGRPAGRRRRGGGGARGRPAGEGRWGDVLPGATHPGPRPPLSDIALRLPVALLVPADA